MKAEFKKILSAPTTSVPEAGRLLGLARNGAYEAARRGEIPTIQLGRKIRVPTAKLKKMIE
jgi:excisionase family DNA binding protein